MTMSRTGTGGIMSESAQSPKKLTGVERSAILLMTLGEQDAAEVLKLMTPKEVQKVGEAMAQLGAVDRETVDAVLAEFCDTVDEQTDLGIGNEEYLRKVLVGALGEDKAGNIIDNIIDRILMGHNAKGLESLKWMEPRAIADVIRLEHPQIIAIILSYLEPDQSAEVLANLPENMRADVLIRVATLDGIQPSALNELDEMLEKQFAGNSDKNIQDLMFVFDNLVDVDDRGIQALLREISSENLIVALKGADEAVKEKILKNMSKRAAEMLRSGAEGNPGRGPPDGRSRRDLARWWWR